METNAALQVAVPAGWRRLTWLKSVAVVGLWLRIVLAGVVAMLHYEFTAGGDPQAPTRWPSASHIPRVPDHATLMVFAHPRCPCTEATMDMLAEIVASTGPDVEIKALFFTPPNGGADWTQTASVRRTATIPGVTVIADYSGREAQVFHAVTSGRTLLYDPQGKLLFDGGITGSRGHVGENAGATRLTTLLTQRSSTPATAPVFGCSILNRFSKCDSILRPR